MSRILILGANGQLARHTTAHWLAKTTAWLVLGVSKGGRP
jgi:uncharacterized protein YbjT (DUF2867 family)